MSFEDLLTGLTKEQIEKFSECKSANEILVLAKHEGLNLTSEQIEAIDGGELSENFLTCPKCGCPGAKEIGNGKYHCPYCGHDFKYSGN